MTDFIKNLRQSITGPEPSEQFSLTWAEFTNKLVQEKNGYALHDLFAHGEWKIAERLGLVKVNGVLVTGPSWTALVNHLTIVESV